jgi:flavorubredoxin
LSSVSRTDLHPRDIDVSISQVVDGIYRIAGFVEAYGITFNQFLIDDDNPILIHTGPIGMYSKIEEKVKEVINIDKLSYVAFLHFESDEWGGMQFLQAPKAKLVCSELSSKLNLTGWSNVPVDHISFWDNEVLKTGKHTFRFIMTPHVHHWDSMMMFDENSRSLFPSDLFIQPGNNNAVLSEDLSEPMIQMYKAIGIFGSEVPVRETTQRLIKLEPKMVFPMHGSCLDRSMFSKYTDALMNNNFAYCGNLLGRKLEVPT